LQVEQLTAEVGPLGGLVEARAEFDDWLDSEPAAVTVDPQKAELMDALKVSR